MQSDNIALPEAAEIRLVQLHKDGRLRVALVQNSDTLQILAIKGGSYALGKRAIEEKRSLRDIINSLESAEQVSYQKTIDQGALLPPVTPGSRTLFSVWYWSHASGKRRHS